MLLTEETWLPSGHGYPSMKFAMMATRLKRVRKSINNFIYLKLRDLEVKFSGTRNSKINPNKVLFPVKVLYVLGENGADK